MQYKLISNTCVNSLQTQINHYLSEGWKLHGPTNSVVKEVWSHFRKAGEDTVYSQALTKD